MSKKQSAEEIEVDSAITKLIDRLANNPAIFSDALKAIDAASQGKYVTAAWNASSVSSLPIVTLGARYARVGQDKLITDMLENGLLVQLKQMPTEKANKICETIVDYLCVNGAIDQPKVIKLLDQMSETDPPHLVILKNELSALKKIGPTRKADYEAKKEELENAKLLYAKDLSAQAKNKQNRLESITQNAASAALFTRDELMLYFELTVKLAQNIDNKKLQSLSNALSQILKAKTENEKFAAESILSVNLAQLIKDLKEPILDMVNDPRLIERMRNSEAFKRLFIQAPLSVKAMIPMIDIAANLDLRSDLPLEANLFKDKDLQKFSMDVYLAKSTPEQRQAARDMIDAMHRATSATNIDQLLLATGNQLLKQSEAIKAVLTSYAQYEQDGNMANLVIKGLDFAQRINPSELSIFRDRNTLREVARCYFDVDKAQGEFNAAKNEFDAHVNTASLKTKLGNLLQKEQISPDEIFVGSLTNKDILVLYERQESTRRSFTAIATARHSTLNNLDAFERLIDDAEFNGFYHEMLTDLSALVSAYPDEFNNLFKILQRKDPATRGDLLAQNGLNLLAEMKSSAAELIMLKHGEGLVDFDLDKAVQLLQDPAVCNAINQDLDSYKDKIIPKIDFALRAFDKVGQLGKYGIDGEFTFEVLKRVNTPEGIVAIDRFVKAPGPINAIRVLTSTGNLGFVANHVFLAYMGCKSPSKGPVVQAEEIKEISKNLKKHQLIEVVVNPLVVEAVNVQPEIASPMSDEVKQAGHKAVKDVKGVKHSFVKFRNLLPGKKIATDTDRGVE